MSSLRSIWNAKNDAAEGFGLGEYGATPRDAAKFARYTVLETQDQGTDREIVLARTGEQYIIVANAHGPWAVDVTAEELGA